MWLVQGPLEASKVSSRPGTSRQQRLKNIDETCETWILGNLEGPTEALPPIAAPRARQLRCQLCQPQGGEGLRNRASLRG